MKQRLIVAGMIVLAGFVIYRHFNNRHERTVSTFQNAVQNCDLSQESNVLYLIPQSKEASHTHPAIHSITAHLEELNQTIVELQSLRQIWTTHMERAQEAAKLREGDLATINSSLATISLEKQKADELNDKIITREAQYHNLTNAILSEVRALAHSSD